jgi:ribosome assembly protein SQT1
LATPANAAYDAQDLEYQLRDSGAKCIFACFPLLNVAIEAASKVGIPRNQIYILDLPTEVLNGISGRSNNTTANQLIEQGALLPPRNFQSGQIMRELTRLRSFVI